MADLKLITDASPVEELVSMLEAALERARNGELRALALIEYTRGHAVRHNFAWAAGVQVEAMVGEAQLLQLSILVASGRLKTGDTT